MEPRLYNKHWSNITAVHVSSLVLRFFGDSRPWVATRYCRDRNVVRWIMELVKLECMAQRNEWMEGRDFTDAGRASSQQWYKRLFLDFGCSSLATPWVRLTWDFAGQDALLVRSSHHPPRLGTPYLLSVNNHRRRRTFDNNLKRRSILTSGYTISSFYKSSAVAEMGDGLATTSMVRKCGGAAVGAGSPLDPHLIQCGLGRGLPLYQVVSWSIQPLGHNYRNAALLRVGMRLRTIFIHSLVVKTFTGCVHWVIVQCQLNTSKIMF